MQFLRSPVSGMIPPPPPVVEEEDSLPLPGKGRQSWWNEDIPVPSSLLITVTGYEPEVMRFRLEMSYGGWRWALWRTFNDIKTFYVTVAKLDRTCFVRLQNHFPIVGSRREGSRRHANNYYNRISSFLTSIAERVCPINCPLLSHFIRFDLGIAPYVPLLVKAQSIWRAYSSRKYHAPILDFVREKALVVSYDLDRRKFSHLYQLAIICANVLLSREAIVVHKAVLTIHALRVPPAIYLQPVKEFLLDGDVGTLSFDSTRGEWVFHQRLTYDKLPRQRPALPLPLPLPSSPNKGATSGSNASPMSQSGGGGAIRPTLSLTNASLSGADIGIANDLLTECICEAIFFEALTACSPIQWRLDHWTS